MSICKTLLALIPSSSFLLKLVDRSKKLATQTDRAHLSYQKHYSHWLYYTTILTKVVLHRFIRF